MQISYIHVPIPSLCELDKDCTKGTAPIKCIDILEIVYPPLIEPKHMLQLSNHVTIVAIVADEPEENEEITLMFSLADNTLSEEDPMVYLGHAMPYGPRDPVFIGFVVNQE